MQHVTIRLLLFFFALAVSGCGADDATRNNTFVPLTGIIISSENPDGIADQTDNQFTAKGFFAGGINRDITSDATWASSDPDILSISNTPGSIGLATANAPGPVTVTAASAGIEFSLPFTVSDASVLQPLIVTPASESAPIGVERDFNVSGNFNDGTIQSLDRIATWESLDPLIAGVTSTGGATGVSVGTARIQAQWQGATGEATLEVNDAELVSLAITSNPSAEDYPVGLTIQYELSGTFTDASTENFTTQAVWESSNEALATVNNTAGEEGEVEMLATGTLDISAKLTGEQETFTRLTINSSTLQDLNILATVLDASGGFDREEVITVGETLTIFNDETVELTSEGEYTNGDLFPVTTQTNWSSSEPSIVTISNNTGFEGIASPGIDTGLTTITASFNILDISFTLDVNPR